MTKQSYLEECKERFIGLTLEQALDKTRETYDWIVTERPAVPTARVPVLVRLENNIVVNVEIPEKVEEK